MRDIDRTMATLKGMAPTTPPPDTCPLIDRTLARLDAVMHDLGEVRLQAMNATEPVDKGQLSEDMCNAANALEGLAPVLEEIRHANARLRNLSLYWYRAAKRLHEEANAQQHNPPASNTAPR